MNCFLNLAEVIGDSDAAASKSYMGNVKNTVFLAMTLMRLHMAHSEVLENDRTLAVLYSMGTESSDVAMAATMSVQYETDSQARDTQCGQWQTMVKSNQSRVGSDNDDRKAIMSIGDKAADVMSVVNSMIVSARRG